MEYYEGDIISKLKDYKRDVQEELEITWIILAKLKVPKERHD